MRSGDGVPADERQCARDERAELILGEVGCGAQLECKKPSYNRKCLSRLGLTRSTGRNRWTEDQLRPENTRKNKTWFMAGESVLLDFLLRVFRCF